MKKKVEWEPTGPTIESLQLDGYKVRICKECKGWGKVPRTDAFSNEYSESTCTECNGTGKRIIRKKLECKPFELPSNSK